MKIKLLFVLLVLIIGWAGYTLQREQSVEKIVAASNSSYNAPLSLNSSSPSMHKPFSVLLQYLVPQHKFTAFGGWLAGSRTPWLKNLLIRYFLSRYSVDMSAAVIENPYDYPSFNSFFTRQLKPDARPIAPGANEIVSPADGFVSQVGTIHNGTLLQAKGFDFSLTGLLGGSEKRARLFENGRFATFYLSPVDYHRVHMPFAGKLRETIFIPGKLFSVNQKTTASVPQLFARNERLVCIFDTDHGPMAVILVGAMLVGSIETVWHTKTRGDEISIETFNGSLGLAKGAELGFFKMGSTVIVLFGKDRMMWDKALEEDVAVRVGQPVGKTL